MASIFTNFRANHRGFKIAITSFRQVSSSIQVKLFRSNENKDESLQKAEKTVDLKTVKTLLNDRRFSGVDLISSTKNLRQVPESIIIKNFIILIESNVLLTTIMKYPSLLGIHKPLILEENISYIKTLPFDINQAIYLALLEPALLHKYVTRSDFTERTDMLTRKLETTTDVVISGFVQRPFLISKNMHVLEEAIDLLKANHVTATDIRKDWWVLLYKPLVIQERINWTRKHNIGPIKTWMVRCTLDILARYVQRRSDDQLALGGNTLIEYLSEHLNCTSEEAKAIMMKHPALQKKSTKRMKEIIDFLYAEGFQPYHIYRAPKVLFHSVKTMKKRLEELRKQGLHMDSLHILTKSQKQYLQYYQSLIKSNETKIEQTGTVSTPHF